MARGIARRLDEALDSMLGRDPTPLREKLLGVPDRVEIRGMLHLLDAAREAVAATPSPEARARHLTDLMEAARGRWAGRVVAPPRRGRWRRVIRPAFVMAAAAVLLAVPLVALAGNAGPGETLYGLKLGVEKLQLALERDPSGDVRLHLEFAGRRLAEASQLFAEGRPAEVDGALVNARSHRRAAGKGVDLLLERKAAPEEIEQQFAPVITQQLERIAELSVKAGCNRADPGAVEPQCKGLLTALEQSQRLLEKVRGSDDRQKTSPEKERTPSPHENPASPQRTPARESPRS